jgi:flagellar assembly protein FliH
MAVIKRGYHALSQQQQKPVQSSRPQASTTPAYYAPPPPEESIQPAWVTHAVLGEHHQQQGVGSYQPAISSEAYPHAHPSQSSPYAEQRRSSPELKDSFLQSLVWDETSVSTGQAPDRRGDPRPIRRGEDLGLLEQAKTEAYYIKEQAREAGFQEGLRQAEKSLDSIWDLLENLQTAHQQALANSVEQIVPIAIEIAEKIIKTEVACDKTLLIAIAKSLLAKVDRSQKQVLFKVHPADVALLKDEIERHPSWRMNDRDILVEEDASVAQGSCVLETAGGLMDANFHTQLKTVRQLLGLPEKAPASNTPLPNPSLDTDDESNWGFKN